MGLMKLLLREKNKCPFVDKRIEQESQFKSLRLSKSDYMNICEGKVKIYIHTLGQS